VTQQGIEPRSELSDAVVDSLSGLPYYLANLAAALVVLTAALAVYRALSKSHEITQARDGNAAAAVSFGGVLIGFALPIASVVLTSGALLDQLLWSGASVVVQLAAILVVRRALRRFVVAVEAGVVSSGMILGMIAIAIGILNAAAAAAF
jgi:putative membrane protein